jgi:hypothetical protein
MKKPYCTQNNGDCSSCSLSNHGLDCKNNPTWGGHREGAGRPATGAMPNRTIRMTDEEYVKVKAFLKELRTSGRGET